MCYPLVTRIFSFLKTKPKSKERDAEKATIQDDHSSPHAHEQLDYPPTTTPIPPKLAKFQTLIGICSPSVLLVNPTRARPAPNEGIYKRTVDEEAKIRYQHTLSNYAVNSFGLLQIILGAALTALGAANGPRGAVTTLGAANTIMAGTLTYLKGQGLPHRLEQYLHLLRTLREHIEEREREFLEPDCPLDIDDEISRVAKMYQEVRQTAEDNAPGTVLPPRGVVTALLRKPDIAREDVPAPRGDRKPVGMLMEGLQDLAHFRGRDGGGGGAGGGVGGKGVGGKGHLEADERDEQSGDTREAVDSELRRAQDGLTHLERMAKDAARRDLRMAGDEIGSLEVAVKERVEKLGGGGSSGSSSGEEGGSGRGKRREG